MTSNQIPPNILVMGSRVTYHGSLSQFTGQVFYVFAGSDGRYRLTSPDHPDALEDVRRASFTPDQSGQWWPEDAIPFRIGDYLHMASHSGPGGSRWARLIHFHLANGELGTTWCRFDHVTTAVQALDDAAKARALI